MTDIGSVPGASTPRLGWRVERRPRPGFAHVLGAAAGAFVVVGTVAFVVELNDDDPTVPGVIFSLVMLALALAAGMRAPGPLRSACVTTAVLAVPLLWAFAFFGGGDGGDDELRGVYLLTLAGYLMLYLLGWTKGRAVFLAGVLLVFASWASFEVSDGTGVVPFQAEVSNSSDTGFGFPDNGSSFEDGDDTSDAAAIAAIVIGIAYLAAGAALDRRRYAGAATPFVAIGAVETLAGAIVLGGKESVLLAGLLTIAAGVAVGLVGGHGDRRRATTWIGVLAVFGGCVAIISDIAPESAAGVGGIAFGFALVLGSVAYWLAPVLGEPDDGDDAPPPPTAPPGGTIEGATLPDAAAA